MALKEKLHKQSGTTVTMCNSIKSKKQSEVVTIKRVCSFPNKLLGKA